MCRSKFEATRNYSTAMFECKCAPRDTPTLHTCVMTSQKQGIEACTDRRAGAVLDAVRGGGGAAAGHLRPLLLRRRRGGRRRVGAAPHVPRAQGGGPALRPGALSRAQGGILPVLSSQRTSASGDMLTCCRLMPDTVKLGSTQWHCWTWVPRSVFTVRSRHRLSQLGSCAIGRIRMLS